MYYYPDKGVHNFKRAFNREELTRFFEIIDDERDYLYFMLQYVLDARISDIRSIQTNDIDVANCQIAFTPTKQRGSKAHRVNVDIPPELMKRLSRYIAQNALEIIYADNFVFHCQNKNRRPISLQTMRTRFNHYRHILGLDKQYTVDKVGHKRPYVRTHTLRATAINDVLRETNGNLFIAMQHSRHRSINGILPYFETYQQEQMKALNQKIFSPVVNVRKPKSVDGHLYIETI